VLATGARHCKLRLCRGRDVRQLRQKRNILSFRLKEPVLHRDCRGQEGAFQPPLANILNVGHAETMKKRIDNHYTTMKI
jgi:hypothetical protein